MVVELFRIPANDHMIIVYAGQHTVDKQSQNNPNLKLLAIGVKLSSYNWIFVVYVGYRTQHSGQPLHTPFFKLQILNESQAWAKYPS
jgi:hypothetical protein